MGELASKDKFKFRFICGPVGLYLSPRFLKMMEMQPNIVQLRQLLTDRFPHLRLACERSSPEAGWPSGIPSLDAALPGGFARSAITEIVSSQRAAGSALVVVSLLQQAFLHHQFVALIDGADSFDPCPLPSSLLERLLWVRCQNVEEAMKAADLVVRDRNLPIVLLDLQINPLSQLRKIAAPVWYRWQRIVEQTATTLLVMTPQPIVSGAHTKVFLKTRFNLDALAKTSEELVSAISCEVADRHDAERIHASA